MAWIIGWDLVLEYAVSSAFVAHGWSHYFQDLLKVMGLHWPHAFGDSPFALDSKSGSLVATGSAFDLPAVAIVVAVTALHVRGIKESARFNAVMVCVKVAIVLFVILVGAFHVTPANWHPFAPFGYGGVSAFGVTLGQEGPGGEPRGVLAGAALIFFAYIGFDAVSTQAEEAVNPARDMPIGILGSLGIATALYICVSVVLTGMVPYDQIDKGAPVSAAFGQVGMPWARGVVSVGALTGAPAPRAPPPASHRLAGLARLAPCSRAHASHPAPCIPPPRPRQASRPCCSFLCWACRASFSPWRATGCCPRSSSWRSTRCTARRGRAPA